MGWNANYLQPNNIGLECMWSKDKKDPLRPLAIGRK